MPDSGMTYFPVKVGSYQIYSVDETQIAQNVEQHFVYDLKVQITDSILNQTGGYTYLVTRQRRETPDAPWLNMDSWTFRLIDRQAVITEGNTPFVKLTFPAMKGLEWDGNTFNSLGGQQNCDEAKYLPCDIYRVEKLDTAYQISSGKIFARTLTVVQNNSPDLFVKYDVRSEIYAAQVGLIQKESVVLEYCTDATCYAKQFVNKGLRFKQVIKEYGSE